MCLALPDKPLHFDVTVFIDVERNPGPGFEILEEKDVNYQSFAPFDMLRHFGFSSEN
jgi:hypothetical protein